MRIIGLTGGIASGKSTVTKIFIENGVVVIDLDQIAKDIVEPGQSAYNQIIKTFGEEYLTTGKGSEIDRKKLGRLIFGDREARKKLDKITHSSIFFQLFKKIIWHFIFGTQNLIIDSPLLFETALYKYMRMTIVIYVDPVTQLNRLLCRDTALTEEDGKNRINAQISLEEKVKKSNRCNW